MKEKISILLRVVPKYGEILLGVGSVLLSYKDNILDNALAIEKIKQYLLTEASKAKDILGVSRSQEFQKIIYEYTGEMVNIMACKDPQEQEKTANIFLVDFFRKSMWPILVNKYIDTIYSGVDKVIISVNIKKNVYLTIYNEDNPDLFFKEFKEFLLYNHVIICEATIKENGDMLVKLMIPMLPNTKIEF